MDIRHRLNKISKLLANKLVLTIPKKNSKAAVGHISAIGKPVFVRILVTKFGR